MPGVRRSAVFATAILGLIAVPATAEPPPHVLPVGTAVVFVADGSLDALPRDNAALAIHLRDPLSLDGTVVAPAGSKAKLMVSYIVETGGHRVPVVRIEQFMIPAGLVPVRPVHVIALPLAAGESIAASTEALIEHIGERFSIRTPFPFSLSGDRPAPYYTASPAKTAPPHTLAPPSRRGGGPPTPLPTGSATPPTPLPTDSAGPPTPLPSGSGGPPTPLPTDSASPIPTPTKSPG